MSSVDILSSVLSAWSHGLYSFSFHQDNAIFTIQDLQLFVIQYQNLFWNTTQGQVFIQLCFVLGQALLPQLQELQVQLNIFGAALVVAGKAITPLFHKLTN